MFNGPFFRDNLFCLLLFILRVCRHGPNSSKLWGRQEGLPQTLRSCCPGSQSQRLRWLPAAAAGGSVAGRRRRTWAYQGHPLTEDECAVPRNEPVLSHHQPSRSLQWELVVWALSLRQPEGVGSRHGSGPGQTCARLSPTSHLGSCELCRLQHGAYSQDLGPCVRDGDRVSVGVR